MRGIHYEIEDKSENEKAMKGIAAYHAQQAIEKITKHLIYKATPDINPSKMYTHKIYDLHFVVKITSVKKAVSLAEKWIESIEQ